MSKRPDDKGATHMASNQWAVVPTVNQPIGSHAIQQQLVPPAPEQFLYQLTQYRVVNSVKVDPSQFAPSVFNNARHVRESGEYPFAPQVNTFNRNFPRDSSSLSDRGLMIPQPLTNYGNRQNDSSSVIIKDLIAEGFGNTLRDMFSCDSNMLRQLDGFVQSLHESYSKDQRPAQGVYFPNPTQGEMNAAAHPILNHTHGFVETRGDGDYSDSSNPQRGQPTKQWVLPSPSLDISRSYQYGHSDRQEGGFGNPIHDIPQGTHSTTPQTQSEVEPHMQQGASTSHYGTPAQNYDQSAHVTAGNPSFTPSGAGTIEQSVVQPQDSVFNGSGNNQEGYGNTQIQMPYNTRGRSALIASYSGGQASHA